MPIGRPTRGGVWIVSARAMWSSALPWEKFMRTVDPGLHHALEVWGRTRQGPGGDDLGLAGHGVSLG